MYKFFITANGWFGQRLRMYDIIFIIIKYILIKFVFFNL
jgi:uncharacterized membrane protein YhdT